MPGLYIHIPFCRKACHYCNFHFSTSLRLKEELLGALHRELEMQSGYLQQQPLNSIYLGGGTPSILSLAELDDLFRKIYNTFPVSEGAEITLEANPDDLSGEKLKDLKEHTPVNRLSIGIQSFDEDDLRWMNRAHNASEAIECLEQTAAAGFDDWTADLIYGLPSSSDAVWKNNIETLLRFRPPHISTYCLTVEEGTALHHFVKKGTSKAVDDAAALRQYDFLMDTLEEQGYQHYEISNFALPGREAQHNSSYWLGEHYLGIGPSAHSYNGVSRQWNIANNAMYIRSIGERVVPFESEHITQDMRYNEYVMTRLRTQWGCRLEDIRQMGAQFADYFLEKIASPVNRDLVSEFEKDAWRVTRAGKFKADGIAVDLFWPG